jgi:hypothetical protein
MAKLPYTPVEMAGIEPARQRLQGATATLAVIPIAARMAPGGRTFPAVELASTKHVHPAGWCSQGPKELNPHRPVLETGALPVELDPYG